ncbi:tripartite tricarboxylate transporter permease [Desulfopila aestuarii]|uniref:Putative tricarboxylic transport membrane protein n=1 Tax=Desulfopila aestuarii DSM 18488 TaxID=1121416 RepID=A0A1M7YF08_9BACT|nr:tripartite tricarboxylate transporter permease [Desulfopila aestuarii]SHO51232.1 putative tricarboxylic transport membrane protein [Desulfopila aestuarii DSM 18488]
MEIVHNLLQGLAIATTPVNLIFLAAGALLGMFFGVIPGISAANGIALMLPVVYTFGLAPETVLILFAGIYYGAKYGCRISAILNNVPGDVSSLATRLDGYPLALAGKGGRALVLTAFSSFFGGMLAILLLGFGASSFADIGSSFGPPEYVALIAFAFVLVLILSSTLFLKNLTSLCLGLMFSVVGLDWGTDAFRYTAGIPELYDGIDFIIVVIGVFALSESLMMMEETGQGQKLSSVVDSGGGLLPLFLQVKWSCLRASVIGVLIGFLPGAGTYVANLAAYRFEKKVVNTPEPSFGSGNIHGLIAPEAANSACALASFLPLLALGIPGSATTAVLHGALLQVNVDPGAALCRNHPEYIWALIISMLLGNILLLIVNVKMIRFFPRLLAIPAWVLMPMIVVVAFVSVYAVSQSVVSLLIMVVIGLLAYYLRKFHYPLGPLILGYVLGKPFEDNMRLALSISGGDFSVFLHGPLTMVLGCSIVIAIVMKVVYRK